MNTNNYQSQSYPTLSHLIEISSRDYEKLRRLMLERGELEKFQKWLRHKYIRIAGQHHSDPMEKGK